MLNDQYLVTTIVSAAWLLTVGGISGPGVKPSCLRKACINDEAGAEIGDDTVDASIMPVAKTVVGEPTTGATLGRKMLENIESLNNNQ